LHDSGQLGLVVDPGDAISSKSASVARNPAEAPGAVLELAERGAEIGWITLLSFASPDRDGRERARQRIGAERYLEIFVSTPIEACRARAPGFYAGAVQPAYEPPPSADLVLDLSREPLEQAVSRVVALLTKRNFFEAP
jgi:adenylylsulfate kinase-like enzyme